MNNSFAFRFHPGDKKSQNGTGFFGLYRTASQTFKILSTHQCAYISERIDKYQAFEQSPDTYLNKASTFFPGFPLFFCCFTEPGPQRATATHIAKWTGLHENRRTNES